MRILVIDVESTCWLGSPPPGEQSEIIEIGVCELDTRSGRASDPSSILVRPTRSKVSAFCTELTSLTPEMVAGGCEFWEACERLTSEFASESAFWASYGEYDRKQFQWQCSSFGVSYPFSTRHLNVKKLFAQTHRLPKAIGMAGAMKKLRAPLQGTHHRRGDDAGNIAYILNCALKAALGETPTDEAIEALSSTSN